MHFGLSVATAESIWPRPHTCIYIVGILLWKSVDSTCNIFYFSFSCSDLDETKVNKVDNDPVPHAMINLETWLPANYQVDGWQVRDLGALGAGGR